MYLYKDDLSIVRNDDNYPFQAVLFDCDGEIIFTFPKVISDTAIWSAVDFANKAYECGFKYGGNSKITAIKSVLQIK